MGAPDPRSLAERLACRVQVVAGKGGVGRTLVATSLALRYARDGQRTLLLEVNAPDSAAGQLGVAPAVDEPREVMNNLWLCRMTPEGSLREYALMVLRWKTLYNLVFENRLVKYLLRSIPSLGEFTMLGKAWYHTTENLESGAPKYTRIIIDAPATGHAITFLSVARVVADVAPAGVMRDASERMARMLEDRQSACLHVVALPEEMPVNEGLDVLAASRQKLRMADGVGFLNRVLPPLFSATEKETVDRLQTFKSEAARPYLEAAQARRDRELWQAEHQARFENRSALPLVIIPDFGPVRVDAHILEQVAKRLSGGPG